MRAASSYGDVSPNSHTGKAITSLAIIAGVIFMAMPLTIVGNNFSDVWADKEKINMVIKIQQHMIDKKLATSDVRKVRRAMSARWPVSTLT